MASDSEPRQFFFWGPSKPPEVTFRTAKSIPAFVQRMMLQSWIGGRFHGGLLRSPCTLSNQLFRGYHVFQGARPPGNSSTGLGLCSVRFLRRFIAALTLLRTWWTEESIGTASGLWLQTGADGELLLPIVLSRTGASKC